MDPDLTTVSRRCVCPPGPVPIGRLASPAPATTTPADFSATATPPPAPAFAALLRSRRWAGIRESPSAEPSLLDDEAAAFSRAACARLRRCSGISVMSDHPFSLRDDHSGPEMPPSLRTRQKWIARKMTVTNGNNNTCNTYQRNKVSAPISTPPRSTKRTCEPMTGE